MQERGNAYTTKNLPSYSRLDTQSRFRKTHIQVSCKEVCRDSAVVRHGFDNCPAEYDPDVVAQRSFALVNTVGLCADYTGIEAG